MRTINHFALALAMLITVTASAQKKTWIIEIDGSIDHQDYSGKYNSPPQTLEAWTFNLAAGKQFSDHFTAGILIGAAEEQFMITHYLPDSLHNRLFSENAKNINSEYKLHLWGRYTYTLDKHFYIYSQFSAGWQINNTRELAGVYSYYSPVTSSISTFTNSTGGGLYTNVFPAIGMNIIRGYGVQMNIGGLSYAHQRVGDGQATYNRLHLNFGKQFFFGLHKIIGWKKNSIKDNAIRKN